MPYAPTELILRPVATDDLEGIHQLARDGGKTLTTLPDDAAFLERRIARSVHAFYPEVQEPGGEAYTFVLESLRDRRLLGISGAYARTGGFDPFYTYRRVRERNSYPPLGIEQSIERLECTTWHKGPSELGSLYLEPSVRGGGVGKLASLGRLLFMSRFPERFEAEVIAEIRGWQDPSGQSPFWEAVIRPFFGAAFEKMDAVSGTGDKEFIGALLPKYPIYFDLLPAAIREVIGRPHDLARPAMEMLLRAGFKPTEFVDVFDAGPMISAPLASLVPEASLRPVNALQPRQDSTSRGARPVGIAFSASLDFRAVLVTEKPDAEGMLALEPPAYEALSSPPGTAAAPAILYYDFN
jgi:arginine N-succinyltransferase